ncbi:hypothetical protein BJY01DRAFT_80500 [Aspergillus pseudoustus]|uniref:Uncharacterized protein n=1 Tax=Aspergillus pseudoustus TaxID=1810923 RepID=A0ABR4J3T9_9EURO
MERLICSEIESRTPERPRRGKLFNESWKGILERKRISIQNRENRWGPTVAKERRSRLAKRLGFQKKDEASRLALGHEPKRERRFLLHFQGGMCVAPGRAGIGSYRGKKTRLGCQSGLPGEGSGLRICGKRRRVAAIKTHGSFSFGAAVGWRCATAMM